MAPRLVGLTAPGGAGKDYAAGVFEKWGWRHLSTGNVIREHLKKLSLPIDRLSLNTAGDYLRLTEGGGYLARECYLRAIVDKPDGDRPILITGVRSMGEAEWIGSVGGTLILIDARYELRRDRRIAGLREGDEALTSELFKQQDDRELGIDEVRPPWMLHLWPVMQSADVTIANNDSQSAFVVAVQNFIFSP